MGAARSALSSTSPTKQEPLGQPRGECWHSKNSLVSSPPLQGLSTFTKHSSHKPKQRSLFIVGNDDQFFDSLSFFVFARKSIRYRKKEKVQCECAAAESSLFERFFGQFLRRVLLKLKMLHILMLRVNCGRLISMLIHAKHSGYSQVVSDYS